MAAGTSRETSGRGEGRAVWLVLGGIASVQVGAAFSKQLFATASPTGMVWLRLAFSALVLLAVARPRLDGRGVGDWGVVVAFGLALAGMNWSFYQAIARMPLGAAVTVEFLGPLLLSTVLSRRLVDLIWVALAASGVVLLGSVGSGATAAGVGFALTAGAGWAAYILLTAATGRRWPGLSGLSLASLVGAAALTVPALAAAGPRLAHPTVVGVGLLVALLSSVVPYSLEMAALRAIPARTFGVLMSLEPAAGALAGIVLLGESLSAVDWVGVGCVVVASAGVTRSAAAPPHD